MCPSRRDVSKIMANGGKWSDLTITKGDRKLVIPQKYINANGSLKNKAIKLINSYFRTAEIAVVEEMNNSAVEEAEELKHA